MNRTEMTRGVASSTANVLAEGGGLGRFPSLFECFATSFVSFGYAIFGDRRLRPDRSVAFDAGIDQTLYRNRLRASATYFYTRLQEVIILDFSGVINPATDPFGRFGGYLNTNGGIACGLELSMTRSLRFFGYVDNLFDREYFESGFCMPGRTGRGGAAFTF
jgi:vitamin B12 transporter